MELNKYLKTNAIVIERELAKLSRGNALIDRAMRYSLMAGGKRLRPMLVMLAAEACGGKAKDVMPAACAIEYIHTYSLIHDDLPAMDNDDLRRGKPTSHKKFGEATAILTGDALLTEAFGLITKSSASPQNIVKAVDILCQGAGKDGMIEGQLQDTVETGKSKILNASAKALTLRNIHLNKTAALIRASLKIGAVLAGAANDKISKLDNYGRYMGLAFQVTDDVLDIVGNKNMLGKQGSDTKNDKLTFPACYGLEKSKKMARQYADKAKKQLTAFRGDGARTLARLADYAVERTY